MKRRLVCFLTALALCLSLLPSGARASDGGGATAPGTGTVDSEEEKIPDGAVAVITSGEGATASKEYRNSFKDAWEYAISKGRATITLIASTRVTGENVQLQEVGADKNITLKWDDTIALGLNEDTPISVNGGTLTIESGTLFANISVTKGNLIVKGGSVDEVKWAAEDPIEGSKIELRGGTFLRIIGNEKNLVSGMLAPGFVIKKNGTTDLTGKDLEVKELAEKNCTYTVKCLHKDEKDREYTPNCDGTHDIICKNCGESIGTGNCRLSGFYQDANSERHFVRCEDCNLWDGPHIYKVTEQKTITDEKTGVTSWTLTLGCTICKLDPIVVTITQSTQRFSKYYGESLEMKVEAANVPKALSFEWSAVNTGDGSETVIEDENGDKLGADGTLNIQDTDPEYPHAGKYNYVWKLVQDDSGKALLSNSFTVTVDQMPLTVTVEPQDKGYDDKTDAAIKVVEIKDYHQVDVLSKFIIKDITAAFADKAASEEAKTVVITSDPEKATVYDVVTDSSGNPTQGDVNKDYVVDTINLKPNTAKIDPAELDITIKATPDQQQAGKDVTVTVEIENPNNTALTELPEAKVTVTYKLKDEDDTVDPHPIEFANGQFTIPSGIAFAGDKVTITVTTPKEAGKYAETTKTLDVSVSTLPLVTATGVDGLGKTYDGNSVTVTPIVKLQGATADSAPVEGVKVKCKWMELTGNSYTEMGNDPVNAGKYKLVMALDGENKDKYILTNPEVEFEIKKAAITIVVDSVTINKDDDLPAMSALTYTTKGLAKRDRLGAEPSLSYKVPEGNPAGKYDIVAVGAKVPTLPNSNDSNPNYEETIEYVNGTLTIKAPEGSLEGAPTLSATDTLTYGQPLSTITPTGKVTLKGSDPAVEIKGEFKWDAPDTKPNAGTYEAHWTFTPEESIYDPLTGTVNVTVNKAPITITVTPATATIAVGDELPKFSYKVEGLVGEEKLTTEPTVSCETKDSSKAGTYKVTATGAEASDNYTITYVPATLTIQTEPVVPDGKTGVTITPSKTSDSKVYDGKPAEYSGTVTVAVKEGTEEVTDTPVFVWSTTDGKAPTDAGTYTLTIKMPDDSKYFGSASVTYTIEKAKLPEGAPTFTKVTGSGMTLADVTLTAPDGWPAGTFEWKDAATTAVEENKAYSYTFTPENSNYESVTGSVTPWGQSGSDTPDTPDTPTPPSTSTDTRTEASSLTAVPEGLRNIPAYNTVSKIADALTQSLARFGDALSWNTAVYDVTLQVSTDGGVTWAAASRENFPADGRLLVRLPYPAGTDSSYRFYAAHMFTTYDFGRYPGYIELPSVYNYSDHLEFYVTGLSPIALGWSKPVSANLTGGVVTTRPSSNVRPSGPSNSNADPSVPVVTETPDWSVAAPSYTVTCDGGSACPSRRYSDLGGAGTWAHEAIDFVLKHGFMSGFEDGTFRPNDRLSRAMVAQILYNKEGRPGVGKSNFRDVPAKAWYANAVAWAANNGIVTGYGDGRFGPEDFITREQLTIMLWRYDQRPGTSKAQDAGYWAAQNGILNGISGVSSAYATRAETAQMLWNFFEAGQARS